MNYRDILSRDRPIKPLGNMRDLVITGTSNAAMMKAARERVRTMDRFSPTDFAVQVTFPCGHQQSVNITKSAIKKRRWSSDIQREIDKGCYACYKTAFDTVEATRKEVVKLISWKQVPSVREAVELATITRSCGLPCMSGLHGGETTHCR